MIHFTNTRDPVDFPMTIEKQKAAAMTAQRNQYLRDSEKKYRTELLEQAKQENVGIVHIFDKNFPQGGLTVAFAKVSQYKSGKMVAVAVATCSSEDVFSKKIGTTLALQYFFAGMTIELPILNNFDERDINYAVKCAFTAMYDHGAM